MNSWPLQPCKVRKKHQLQSNSCHMPWTTYEFQKKLTLPCNIFVLMPEDWVFLLQSWKQDIHFVYIFTYTYQKTKRKWFLFIDLFGSYILKMMQIVCIIASEARWWCRWWGWPQLKPTTHDQPQRIPLHQKGFHPDKSRVLFQVLFSGWFIIDIWYTLFNYRKCHGLNFFIYR